jgi:hypothetical protein
MLMERAKAVAKEVMDAMNEFFSTEWMEYRKKVESTQVSVFTDVPTFSLDN